MTHLKTLAAAAALLASSLASATATLDATAYSVTYDDTTVFGAISSSSSSSGDFYGFEWTVPTTVSLANNGGPAASASFALPSFTFTVKPGYMLSGSFVGSLGNLTYTEFGGASSVLANATVSVNNGADMVLPTTPLNKLATNGFQGYFNGSASLPAAGVTSIQVKDASITLNIPANSFAGIGGQPQNKLSFSFQAVPVPEPESYAMLLAGLGVVGLLARRRRAI